MGRLPPPCSTWRPGVGTRPTATLARAILAAGCGDALSSRLGALYWVDDHHPQGWYRTAETLELAAALVVGGHTWQQPAWVVAGQRAVAFVYTHAYLPTYRVYLGRMGTVVLPDGQPNPNEAILRVSDDAIPDDGGAIQTGDIAREASALATIGQATADAALRQQATTLLTDLLPTTNHLNLWDADQGGYAAQVRLLGTAYRYAGRPLAPDAFKRPQDHALVLLAEPVVGLDPATDGGLAVRLQQTLLGPALAAHGPGVYDRVTADWQPLPLPGGGQADWYSSLAQVRVVLALLAGTDVAATPTAEVRR